MTSCLRSRKSFNVCSFNEVPIKIFVGPSKEVLYIYPSLVRKPDNVFDLALQPCWKEGQEGKVNLTDHDPYIFRLYAGWLYEGKIFCKSNATTTARDYDTLIGLYLLGEYVQDKRFQDRVVDALLATYEEVNNSDTKRRIPDRCQITRIYKQTPMSLPLRRLIVDWCVREGMEVDDDLRNSMEEESNRDFALDLLAASFKRRELTGEAKKELKNRAKVPRNAYYHDDNDQSAERKTSDDENGSSDDGFPSMPKSSRDRKHKSGMYR